MATLQNPILQMFLKDSDIEYLPKSHAKRDQIHETAS